MITRVGYNIVMVIVMVIAAAIVLYRYISLRAQMPKGSVGLLNQSDDESPKSQVVVVVGSLGILAVVYLVR